MDNQKPQLAIVARVDAKAACDLDRVDAMRCLLTGDSHSASVPEDRIDEFKALSQQCEVLKAECFEENQVWRFSRLVSFGQARVWVVLDICEDLNGFAKKADEKFIIRDLPVFALVRSDSEIKRDKVHVAVRALGAWDNAMCALSLEDAAKLFDLDCDFYEDSPVRVVTDEPSRFYTSALVAPGSAAFLSTCGAEPLQRSQAIVNVLKKASEILIRRWDIAAAAVAEGKNKKPVV